jgi:hypothetical protein
MGTNGLDYLFNAFDSQLFWGVITLILAAFAFSGKLSMGGSIIFLALAWVVGCIGIYRTEVIRDWYTMLAFWLFFGGILALLASWLQPSAPPIHRPEPAPPLHVSQPYSDLQKEASTNMRPQERTVDDTLREVLIGKNSRLTPFGKLSYLERQAHYLRIELKEAAPKDKLALIRKLEQTLTQQLDLGAHQRPSNQYKEQFDKIVKELEDLRDLEKTLKL